MEENRGLGYEDIRPLLDRLLALLQARLGERLLAVALYGSLARGQARPTSDMDLLIVYRDDRMAVFDQFMEMLLRDLEHTPEWMELRHKGIKPDPYPVFFNQAELADTPWLLLDIQDHGIILSSGPPSGSGSLLRSTRGGAGGPSVCQGCSADAGVGAGVAGVARGNVR